MSDSSNATRWTVRLGLGGVTALAAWASYLHALGVVQAADGRTLVAWFLPGVADLLIAAASANLLDASRGGHRLPRASIGAIVLAVGFTLLMNVAAADPHEVPKWLVNVWPPVAFILALESFLGHVRRGRGSECAQPAPAAPLQCIHLVEPGASAGEKAVAAFLHMRDCEGAQPTYREVGRRVGIHHNTVRDLLAAAEIVSTNGSGPDE
jgi:hypothetical protein